MSTHKAPESALMDFSSALLNRLSTELPEGDPVQQIDAILDRVDLELYVPSINPSTLFELIQRAGWEHGSVLVPYASIDQIRVFLDFDVWRSDRFLGMRMDRWITTLLQETTDDTFRQTMRALDPEIIALYAQGGVEVMDTDEEGRIPDSAPDHAVLSPDGTYVLIYPKDEDRSALFRALFARLYDVDRALAWTLLEATRWELPTEMEEVARRWRMSRLEEFGFLSREEALEVYTLLDPSKFRQSLAQQVPPKRLHVAPDYLDLPRIFKSELQAEFLIVRLIKNILDDSLMSTRLHELALLNNKTLVADGIEPGEIEGGRQVIRRTLGYLSLGIDFLSRGNEEVAQEILEVHTLLQIFRIGYSLTAQLQRQAHQLPKRPSLTLIEGERFSLLREHDTALLEALLRKRPTYSSDAYTHELFMWHHQIEDVAKRLGHVAFKQLWLFGIKRFAPKALLKLTYERDGLLNEPIDITFDLLFATHIARFMIDTDPSFEPLTHKHLATLLAVLHAKPWESVGLDEFFATLFEQSLPFLPGASGSWLKHWLSSTVQELVEELGSVESATDAQIVRGLLLLQSS